MRLTTGLLAATLLAGLGLLSIAHADEAEADSCLRTKIWDGYNDGWSVRTASWMPVCTGWRTSSRSRALPSRPSARRR